MTESFSDYFDDGNKEVNTEALYTDEMGVGDIHHLVERLMLEARPQQFVRELVQNSIESGATEIEISPDWHIVEETKGKTYRFMIADNGCGMGEQELVEYMNKVSCSGHGVSVYGGNYGIGAKIACLGWNRNGMIVMSWKEGVGRLIRLWKDPQTGKYGLRRYVVEDEATSLYSVIEAPEEYKPSFIKDHGTVIILCGNEENEDTWYGPENTMSYGHISELNTRYMELNSEVRLRVHALPADRKTWPKNKKEINAFTKLEIRRKKRSGWSGTSRLIKGARYYLDSMSEEKGSLEAEDFKIHWFLLKANRRTLGGLFPAGSFISTVYENELYDTQRGAFAMKYYSLFGIYRKAVSKNVVIIVEPSPKTEENEGVITDSARSRLIHTGYRNGEGLPWEVYSAYFRENMPEPIKKAMENIDTNNYDNVNQAIENDLKHLIKSIRRPVYRRKQESVEVINPEVSGAGGFDQGKAINMSAVSGRENKSDGTGAVVVTKSKRRIIRSYSVLENTGVTAAERKTARSILPTLRWVSEEAEEGLKGFVARYDKYNHVLFINLDFKSYRSLLDSSLERHASTAQERQIVAAVQRIWGRFLAARILSVYSYRGSESWTESRWDNSVSPESLTMSVAGGYKMETDVSQILKHLTSPRTFAAAKK